MRTRVAMMIALSGLLYGASCLPLVDGNARPPVTGRTFAVALSAPQTSRTIPVGTQIEIAWSAANRTGIAAEAYVLVESRTTLRRTRLAEDLDATDVSSSGTVIWDTTGFAPGPYAIVAQLRSAAQTDEFVSEVRITIDVPPTLDFRAPTNDVTFTQGDTLRIRWIARDLNGTATARVGLDPDDDHTNGNEIVLVERPITDTSEAQNFDFSGNAADNQAVPVGTYNLYAELDDEVNAITFVEAGVRVTVQ